MPQRFFEGAFKVLIGFGAISHFQLNSSQSAVKVKIQIAHIDLSYHPDLLDIFTQFHSFSDNPVTAIPSVKLHVA